MSAKVLEAEEMHNYLNSCQLLKEQLSNGTK